METTYIISIASIGDNYICSVIPTTDEGQQPSERYTLSVNQVNEIVTIIKSQN